MSMHQLRTQSGQYRHVELINNGGTVENIRLYRHSGDHDEGNEDSWFVEADVRFTNQEGDKFLHPFHMRCHEQHGRPKAGVAALAGKILLAGTINMKHWRCSNVTERY